MVSALGQRLEWCALDRAVGELGCISLLICTAWSRGPKLNFRY